MNLGVRVLCTPEVAAGFVLAGLTPVEVATPADGAAELGILLAAADAGVVLMEDRLYDSLPHETRRALTERPLPLVVPFPGAGPREGRREAFEARIAELLRQAIGYRVRLR